MNTSPQQSSPCCIFASRAISAREAFLQHGVFGKRLDFGVNRAESEFFSNIIYLYNINRYMFTVYYPLVGRGNQGRKEGRSGGSLVGKQLTSKQSEGARLPLRRGGDPTRTLGTGASGMLASERDGEVVAAARAIVRTLKAAGADIHVLAERVEGDGSKLTDAEMRSSNDAGVRARKPSSTLPAITATSTAPPTGMRSPASTSKAAIACENEPNSISCASKKSRR